MAFNKVSMMFLLLIAATIADAARVEFLINSKTSQSGVSKLSSSGPGCCDNCKVIFGQSVTCVDVHESECPESCDICVVTVGYPPRYVCRDLMSTCPPLCYSAESKFPTSLLALKSMNKY